MVQRAVRGDWSQSVAIIFGMALSNAAALVDSVEAQGRPDIAWMAGGHYGGSATSVAYSPDGLVLATGGDRVTLWRLSDGMLVRTLGGPVGGVNCVAYSPDGKLLASGDRLARIHFWNTSDGRLLQTLANQSAVRALAFSPDRRTLASAGSDRNVRLWRYPDGELLFTMAGHTDSVCSVAFSLDGLVDVHSVQFSPDGRHFAYGRRDATAVLARNPFVDRPGCGMQPRLTARRKHGGTRVMGVLRKASAFAPVTCTLDGESPVERITDVNGRAAITYTDVPRGRHTVRVCDLEARS